MGRGGLLGRCMIMALVCATGGAWADEPATTFEVVTTYTYDANGRLVQTVTDKSGGTAGDHSTRYEYDDADNLKCKADDDDTTPPSCPT